MNSPSNSTVELSRNAIIKKLSENQNGLLDIVIIGGGIHGANMARLAALSGYKVALFEKNDYASATSSRSSKMAHGGLRYLEMGDLEQVFEGIKSREKLFVDFPYLVKPYKFLIPVAKYSYFFRLKLKIGLLMYDFLLKKKERKHSWIPRSKLSYEVYSSDREDLAGCYSYTDGILSDGRLVIENLYRARDSGAYCINHSVVQKVSKQQNGTIRVDWKDQIQGVDYSTKAKIIINCAGPWAPFIENENSSPTVTAKYSQGTHLLFEKQWKDPALFLPMEGHSRYYFVWPHPSGTMIGTTEREVKELAEDPTPHPDEIKEILDRIEKDLPNTGINKKSLYYAFSGIRTLAVKQKNQKTETLSRKHIWQYSNGMLTLVGGKLTTAEWTAWEGLKIVDKKISKNQCSKNIPTYHYPTEKIQKLKSKAEQFSLNENQVQLLLNRYGERAEEVIMTEDDCKVLTEDYLTGELRYAIEVEQAETVEDIMRRRIEIEYRPGAGFCILEKVCRAFENAGKKGDFSTQVIKYKERLTSIGSKLKDERPTQ